MSTGSTPAATRRPVATYTNYREAERAVDWLSDRGFEVQRVTIVGTGLRYIEQVAGRVTIARAALAGAGQGALIGLLFALLFGIFFTGPGFGWLLLYAVIIGAAFGATLGAVMHAGRGGTRDFASVARTEADRYELQVDDTVAGEAERLLASMPPGGR